MRHGGIASLTTLGLAVATAWFVMASKPEVHASPAPQAPPQVASYGDRLFLTRQQLAQALASGTLDRPVKSLLAVSSPLKFGDFRWDDRGVPNGPTWIRVDLGSQLISVFRAGHEIGTSVIVYGGENKQTPAGRLHILAKARNHRSSLYDADMPYTLRLTGDGVSIHASSVRWGAATHGCIGVPLPFAQRLFSTARVGDDVVVVGTPPRRMTS